MSGEGWIIALGRTICITRLLCRVSPTVDAPSDLRELFGASGQLGRDLLAVDWAATPLGPLEQWPQSLKTIVQVLVTSRFSMWMAWEPELTRGTNVMKAVLDSVVVTPGMSGTRVELRKRVRFESS